MDRPIGSSLTKRFLFRKNFQKALEAMQAALESESKVFDQHLITMNFPCYFLQIFVYLKKITWAFNLGQV
jgi:hypothetical protein